MTISDTLTITTAWRNWFVNLATFLERLCNQRGLETLIYGLARGTSRVCSRVVGVSYLPWQLILKETSDRSEYELVKAIDKECVKRVRALIAKESQKPAEETTKGTTTDTTEYSVASWHTFVDAAKGAINPVIFGAPAALLVAGLSRAHPAMQGAAQ